MEFDHSTDTISPDDQAVITFGGTGAIVLPMGTTSERPPVQTGAVRYNTDEESIEGVIAGAWTSLAPRPEETNPTLSYTSGVLTQIVYDSGNTKTFAYTSGVLTQLDYVVGASTTRKTFNYNPDGTLASINQTII